MTCEYTYRKPMLGSLDPQSLNALLCTILYSNSSSSNGTRGPKCISRLEESPKDWDYSKGLEGLDQCEGKTEGFPKAQAVKEQRRPALYTSATKVPDSRKLEGEESKDISIQFSDRSIVEPLYPNIYMYHVCTRAYVCHVYVYVYVFPRVYFRISFTRPCLNVIQSLILPSFLFFLSFLLSSDSIRFVHLRRCVSD